MGLVAPSGGTVTLDGTSNQGWAPHRVARAGVAYVPEGRLIFPDITVVENIRVAERKPAKAWPLEKLLELFPSLRERQATGARSSRRRAADAVDRPRARQRPTVLLLDEPSQGLAPLVVRELARVIRLLRDAGVTILLIEQNMKLAEVVADKLHIMVKGRMVYSADPQTLPRRGAADSHPLSDGLNLAEPAIRWQSAWAFDHSGASPPSCGVGRVQWGRLGKPQDRTEMPQRAAFRPALDADRVELGGDRSRSSPGNASLPWR